MYRTLKVNMKTTNTYIYFGYEKFHILAEELKVFIVYKILQM